MIETTKCFMVALALAAPGDGWIRVQDPLQPGQTTVGALGRGPAGPIERTARGWLESMPLGRKLGIERGLETIDVQDGTPVRLVRLKCANGDVVGVVLGAGTEVIGVSVSPGAPAERDLKRDPVVAPGRTWFMAGRLGGPSRRADELEKNALEFAERGRREVFGYGAGDRWDSIVGRLRLIVDQTHTRSGRPLASNAFYSSPDHTLQFAREDAFPSAADGSIVVHELGHAVWHALTGTEPVKKATTVEELAVYEGHADAFAALVTGDPVVGAKWLPPNGDEPRDLRTRVRHGDAKADGQHVLGTVYGALLWDLGQGRDRDTWRRLVLGSIQLAPHPITPASLVCGLLLADAFFHGGRNTQAILKLAAARGVPMRLVR